MKLKMLFTSMMMFALLVLLPATAFAAEGAVGVNPPGWVGGSLAALALALAIGTGLWARNKRL